MTPIIGAMVNMNFEKNIKHGFECAKAIIKHKTILSISEILLYNRKFYDMTDATLGEIRVP